jgi:hypothetical protein
VAQLLFVLMFVCVNKILRPLQVVQVHVPLIFDSGLSVSGCIFMPGLGLHSMPDDHIRLSDISRGQIVTF